MTLWNGKVKVSLFMSDVIVLIAKHAELSLGMMY
jgi:hypothetical protein